MMSWDDTTWNVFHQEDNADDGYFLWVVSPDMTAVLPGEHLWNFVNKATGERERGQGWHTEVL
jgi:hypothetical protein